MTSKISTSTPISNIENPLSNEVSESGSSNINPTASDDPVTQIALQVMEGTITADQAVEKIITQTMNMPMVEQAPQSLKDEVRQVLTDVIESDPYLQSLVTALD